MMEDLKREIDLPEGTLVTNLFVPCMVVCSKIDLIEHGERDVKEALERNLDYIQNDLRKFCLRFGASLIFASSN
jgi:dynein light intermediate chain 1